MRALRLWKDLHPHQIMVFLPLRRLHCTQGKCARGEEEMACVLPIQLEFTGKRLAATRSIQLGLSELACAPHYDSLGARCSKKETRCGANGVNSFVAEAKAWSDRPPTRERRARYAISATREPCRLHISDRLARAGGRAAEQSISLRPSYRAARYIYIRGGVHSKLQSAHLLSLVYSSARRKQHCVGKKWSRRNVNLFMYREERRVSSSTPTRSNLTRVGPAFPI
jgi:hypothetical protein